MKIQSISRLLTSPVLIAASFVVALGGPVTTASAQLSLQSSLDKFKQQITTAIDSSVTKLQQSSESLDLSISVNADKNGVTGSVSGPAGSASGSVNKDGTSGQVNGSKGSSASGSINKDGASGTAKTNGGSSASGSVNKDGATGKVEGSKVGNAEIVITKDGVKGNLSVSPDLKKKLQETNKKAIDKLKELKAKVEATASLDELKAQAKEFDQDFKEIATANVQATVTKAIDSMTEVLDRLQVVANKLETRVTKLKECIEKGSVEADANANSSGASANLDASAPGCAELSVDVNSGDNAASLEGKLAEIRSTLQTIRSFIGSSISLVSQLKFGNYSGTMTSFKGILSQVDIVASLSADVQNDLVNLSAAVNK